MIYFLSVFYLNLLRFTNFIIKNMTLQKTFTVNDSCRRKLLKILLQKLNVFVIYNLRRSIQLNTPQYILTVSCK